MPVCQKFNVENKEYTLIPVISKSMEKDSLELIANSAVKKLLDRINSLTLGAQNKQLSESIGGANYVENFIQDFGAHRTFVLALPYASDTDLVTAGGAYADKSVIPVPNLPHVAGATNNFTALGAWRYFDGCTTPLEWLKHVFGNDYLQKLARGYFVD